jgi:hypothetical protein
MSVPAIFFCSKTGEINMFIIIIIVVVCLLSFSHVYV